VSAPPGGEIRDMIMSLGILSSLVKERGGVGDVWALEAVDEELVHLQAIKVRAQAMAQHEDGFGGAVARYILTGETERR
jgi:hypothetical protein